VGASQATSSASAPGEIVPRHQIPASSAKTDGIIPLTAPKRYPRRLAGSPAEQWIKSTFYLLGKGIAPSKLGTSIVIWEGSLCHNVPSWRTDPKQYGEADLFRTSHLPLS
jgi:hypothetical protein